jgi:hypothetical protein
LVEEMSVNSPFPCGQYLHPCASRTFCNRFAILIGCRTMLRSLRIWAAEQVLAETKEKKMLVIELLDLVQSLRVRSGAVL